MKVRVKVRPSGILNGRDWPEAGEVMDLPDSVAEGMIAAGTVEAVKAAAEKKDAEKVETRPASKADTETRKK